MDHNTIFFNLLFSIIGIGFFSYGRKHNPFFMLSGIALMVYTYFVSSLGWLITIGAILVILPFFTLGSRN